MKRKLATTLDSVFEALVKKSETAAPPTVGNTRG
jgi:hypothetical protein